MRLHHFSLPFLLALLFLSLPAVESRAQVRICAHRGFWDQPGGATTENSLASLRGAQENGFWGSEFDLHLTADSLVVVHHDPWVADGSHIHRTAYADLAGIPLANGETLPTLDAYLDQGMGSPCMLVVEFKWQDNRKQSDKMIALTLEALRQRDLLSPEKVLFISFDYEACRRVAALLPGFTVQYLEGDKDPETVFADGINGIDFNQVSYHKHPDWVARAHALGMSVNVWTVDDASEMQYMIDLGVDCITTNKPLLLRQLLGEKEIR
ncbi:MAG: glycerophosphodiester phosphodiesterase [Bacteroidales bacterium]|nr:glycerophosphodiester phosphodiesterase [Bacteroidales bacterium]